MRILLPSITLPSDVKASVIEFALNTGIEYFVSNGSSRRYCNINHIDVPLRDTIQAFAKQVYQNLDIVYKEEPMFGNFIGVNDTGGSVHPHTDSKNNRLEHARLNILISKPVSGGMPVIDNKEHIIEEDECWFNWASKWLHCSTPVIGVKPRIVLSIGCLMSYQDVAKIAAKTVNRC